MNKRNYENKFKKFLQNPDNVWVIHYSCSDFNQEPSVISSISLRRLKNDSVTTFAIKENEDINESEKKLLQKFFEHTKNNPEAKYIHWNMYSAKYGFLHIQNRFKALFSNDNLQQIYHTDNELNLSPTLYEMYGDNYIDDHKMEQLMIKNNLNMDGFLNGETEASDFRHKHFHRIKSSCIRKVSNLAALFELTHKKKLKTNSLMRKLMIKTCKIYIFFKTIID